MWEGGAVASSGSGRDLPNVLSLPRAHREPAGRWAGDASREGATAAALPAVGKELCRAARSLPHAADADGGGLAGSRVWDAAWLDLGACKHTRRASERGLSRALAEIVPLSEGPAWRIDAAPGIDRGRAVAHLGVDRPMSFVLPGGRHDRRHPFPFPWARRPRRGAAGEHGPIRR